MLSVSMHISLTRLTQQRAKLTLTKVRTYSIAVSFAVKGIYVGVQVMLEVVDDALEELLIECMPWHARDAQSMEDDRTSLQALPCRMQ